MLRPDGPGPGSSRVFGWIVAQQARFYQALSHALSASRADGSELLLLAGLSFAYGIFHAAGPGHGKTVIASYLVATDETFRRGVALAFAAAAAQALSAIVLVGAFAVLLGLTGKAIGLASWWLEAASYAVIIGLGLVLVWRKGRGLVQALARGGPGGRHGARRGRHGLRLEPRSHARTGDARRSLRLAPRRRGGVRRRHPAVLRGADHPGVRPRPGPLWTGIAATLAMAVGTAITVALIATLAVTAKAFALRLASIRPGGSGALLLHGCEVLAGLVVLAFGGASFG